LDSSGVGTIGQLIELSTSVVARVIYRLDGSILIGDLFDFPIIWNLEAGSPNEGVLNEQ
jgi:hypothetical protein